MKRIAAIVSSAALLATVACKHKEDAPAPAASTPSLPSKAILPPADSAPGVTKFEGEVALLASGKFAERGGAPVNMTLSVKGDRFRIDVPEALTASRGLGKAYLLALPTDKKFYAILEAKKQAVLIELEKVAAQAKAFGAHAPAKTGAKPAVTQLEKTGKVDTVAGSKCEIWHYGQGKVAGDVCIAEQETAWFQLPLGTFPEELSWLSPLADGKHLPLRFVAIEQGAERGRIEVTSIQQKLLPASQFELPADYAVLSLDQVLSGLMGGFGGPPSNNSASPVTLPPGVNPRLLLPRRP